MGKTVELVEQAIELHLENNDLDDDTMAALLANAEESISVLIESLASITGDVRKLGETLASAAGDLTEYIDHTEALERQLELMIQQRAWVEDQTAKIKNVRGLIMAISDHAFGCKIAHACEGHAEMEGLARAMERYLG